MQQTAEFLFAIGAIILPIVISTTVFFELIGPVFTRMALRHT
ncbi:MAG: hypothetical protein ABFS45_25920 [Pseudomonadota bacterium]